MSHERLPGDADGVSSGLSLAGCTPRVPSRIAAVRRELSRPEAGGSAERLSQTNHIQWPGRRAAANGRGNWPALRRSAGARRCRGAARARRRPEDQPLDVVRLSAAEVARPKQHRPAFYGLARPRRGGGRTGAIRCSARASRNAPGSCWRRRGRSAHAIFGSPDDLEAPLVHDAVRRRRAGGAGVSRGAGPVLRRRCRRGDASTCCS